MKTRTCALALLISSAAWGQSETAGTSAAAIAKQGVDLYDAGHYEQAAQQLMQAYAVLKVPTVALHTARALAKIGRLVAAAEVYLQATRLAAAGSGDAAQEQQARQEAAQEREALLPRIPTLVLRVAGAAPGAVSVTIDGVAAPPALWSAGQLVDPGRHLVVAKQGGSEVGQEATLAEGESRSVVLDFESARVAAAAPVAPAPAPFVPAPTQPAEPTTQPASDAAEDGSLQRALGWVAVGIGGTGLLAGAIAGAAAMSQRSALQDDGCANNTCYVDQGSDVGSYNTLRSVSTVGFVLAGVGLATGVTLLLSAPSQSESVPRTGQVQAWVGLGSAGVRGAF